MIKKNIFILFFLLQIICLKAQAEEPKIKTAILNNGIKLTMIQVKENPVISSILVMKVGLKHETEQNNGVSHLLEHLTFNGTTKRTQKQLYDDFDRIGCYNNASTGDHYTGYYILTKKDFFNKGIEIQEDMLFNSIIPKNKIDKEKKIVLQEIRKDRMSPYFEKDKILRYHLFPNTPYGMKVIGDEISVQSIKRNEIVDFYKKYYSPKNCVALVIGDFEFKEIEKTLNNSIGKVKREFNEEGENSTIHFQNSENVKIYDYNGRSNSFNFFIDGAKCNSNDFASQEVLSSILNNKLQDEFSNSVDNISCSTTYTVDYGYLQIEAILKKDVNPDDFSKSVKEFVFNKFSFTEKEVNNVKSTLKSDFLFALERPHFFGMLYASYLAGGKSDLLFYNEVDYKNTLAFLKQLSKSHVISVAYLKNKESK